MLTLPVVQKFDYTTVNDVTHLNKSQKGLPLKTKENHELNVKALGKRFDYTSVGDVNFHETDVYMPTSRANKNCAHWLNK